MLGMALVGSLLICFSACGGVAGHWLGVSGAGGPLGGRAAGGGPLARRAAGRRSSHLLILICSYANEPETKDPHHPAIQTVSSQNRTADFQNSFFPGILDLCFTILRSPFSHRLFRF